MCYVLFIHSLRKSSSQSLSLRFPFFLSSPPFLHSQYFLQSTQCIAFLMFPSPDSKGKWCYLICVSHFFSNCKGILKMIITSLFFYFTELRHVRAHTRTHTSPPLGLHWVCWSYLSTCIFLFVVIIL